jgi:hypothetical protein
VTFTAEVEATFAELVNFWNEKVKKVKATLQTKV